WVGALVAAGRPVETAIVGVATRGVGSPLMDATLASVSRSYALGAPLFGALAREARRVGLDELARLAADLERARDLGQGAATVLADERERTRAAERARSLEAAGNVEGQLMLVLVLCYLPALMLLVVIPLFRAAERQRREVLLQLRAVALASHEVLHRARPRLCLRPVRARASCRDDRGGP